MSPIASIRTVLRKYADFTGRARRSEFWWWALFTGVVSSALGTIPPFYGEGWNRSTIWESLFNLAVLLPTIAVQARRLHDSNRSGWWQLIGIVPIIGWIMLLIWDVTDSDPGPNDHGPSPKELPDPSLRGVGH